VVVGAAVSAVVVVASVGVAWVVLAGVVVVAVVVEPAAVVVLKLVAAVVGVKGIWRSMSLLCAAEVSLIDSIVLTTSGSWFIIKMELPGIVISMERDMDGKVQQLILLYVIGGGSNLYA
jgi:hypothetical protein